MGIKRITSNTAHVTRCVALVLFLFAFANSTTAAVITVTAPAELQHPQQVHARLQRLDHDAPPRELTLSLDVPSEIDTGEGLWEVVVTTPGIWAAPVTVSQGQAIQLRLWRCGLLTGSVGGEAPASGLIQVMFKPQKGGSPGETFAAGTTACTIHERQWTCEIPEGDYDLQFSLGGFATEFRWGVTVVPQQLVKVGRLDFTPGASLSGRLQFHDQQKAKLDGIEVSVAALSAGPRDPVRRLVAVADERGFFQFKGVPPGQYLVRAAGKGLVAQPRSVDVIAGVNAVLREPLVVAAPRRVTITLVPPLDPKGERWLVELYGTAATELVQQSLASPSGLWTAASLIPGEYLLNVRQQNNAIWKSQPLTMATEDVALVLPVEGQRVVGRVTLGDRAVPATVQFGGETGEPLDADSDGRFEGVVPRSAEGTVTVLVTCEAPEIRRHVQVTGTTTPGGDLSYDIQLPNTTILGRTIDENGSPVPFAILTIRSDADIELHEQPSSREDGMFQIAGFEPGKYRLQAASFKKSSAVIEVDASDSSSPVSVDVVLRATEEVRGEVMMGSVRIAAAEIFAVPKNTSSSFVPFTRSEANGRFLLTLPPGTITYDVIVFPPGFAVTAGRIVREGNPVLHVETTQHGGTLVVDAPAGARLFLVRDGGEFLLTWVSQKAGGSVRNDAGRQSVIVPNLEPGPYRICAQNKCVDAYVPRMGTATATWSE